MLIDIKMSILFARVFVFHIPRHFTREERLSHRCFNMYFFHLIYDVDYPRKATISQRMRKIYFYPAAYLTRKRYYVVVKAFFMKSLFLNSYLEFLRMNKFIMFLIISIINILASKTNIAGKTIHGEKNTQLVKGKSHKYFRVLLRNFTLETKCDKSLFPN